MSTLQKIHSPYVPVQVGDVVLSFPFRPIGAEGGPNKVLLSSRPIYHHSPPTLAHRCALAGSPPHCLSSGFWQPLLLVPRVRPSVSP